MITLHEQIKRKRTLIVAFAFSLISGFVDVLGFLVLGGFFLSFMSGNSTKLGWYLARLDFPTALEYLVVIASFIFGAFLGDLIATKIKKDVIFIVLFSELFLFIVALLLSYLNLRWTYILPFTIAMGLQNTAQVSVNNTVIGKSFVSGMLYTLGVSLSRLVQGKGNWKDPSLVVISWLCFISGSIIGTFSLMMYSFTTTVAILSGFVIILIAFLYICEKQKPGEPIRREHL